MRCTHPHCPMRTQRFGRCPCCGMGGGPDPLGDTGPKVWFCMTHPYYIADKPGTCPTCNAALISAPKLGDGT